MRFLCPLIVVNNIEASRNFYEKVLNQKVQCDFGENVSFESGFAIHLKSHFSDLIGINKDDIAQKSNNFELYFEEDDLDSFLQKLKGMDSMEYVHELKEQPWGQRVIRFYDPDMHIIEVGEPMESVVKRFLNKGMSIEETVKRTLMPEEFVRQYL
ncbi:MAG: glyoxalase/bleomycin resistance/dioxygenase family protein [Methanosarcina flavescens]|jgi:catechol 2,3-dioxygenase-like lactoylglutathione lyase family enzyme|uniref:Glyoxalase/bleomycin resistance/dioxygenase family protein n=1 Tax=Methanosarcina flavescens TaxID=1715806 RepID=A0A660HSR5_9EURY|nr:glyoxalase/bleomycin resistance/dioxygenase family protein [Methanosarcina flavescens]AYK15272.1 glyoxalase/bleomycin resistance/dioxygenase family protein [Methanosarcina flavescens]NLK32117.1 glyoxalase/bleomycin resistance/dioxygenase family protein [Methanosarcina flavescens]